jgi:Tfp pilus assembly protein PilV
MCDKPRTGSTLIEVLIAVVVLATAGTALVTMLGQTQRTMRDVSVTERTVMDASDQLARLLVLDRASLATRAGRFNTAGWTIEIVQVSSKLYDVSIAASDTAAPLLRTTLYRPDSADAAPR